MLKFIKNLFKVKCIECCKKVVRDDGLVMNEGFVCTSCLYETSTWVNEEFMSDDANYMMPPEKWFKEK